jgi:hypothetical protein
MLENMNTKPIVILAACAFLIGGCNKSPTPQTANNNDTQPPPPVQAEPFHGQVYKSLNGRNVLTLTSKDECELSDGRTTLLCKYTKQSDALRVIVTAMGTTQVIYFRFTNQGLVESDDGTELLSQDAFDAKMQQIRLAKQREEEEQNNATHETQILGTYTLSAVDSYAPSQAILTDVSLKLSRPSKSWIINFADIRDIGTAGRASSSEVYGFGVFHFDTTDAMGAVNDFLWRLSVQDANDMHDAVLNSYKAWAKKFPNKCRLDSNSNVRDELQKP